MDYAPVADALDVLLSFKDTYNHHGPNVAKLSLKILDRLGDCKGDRDLLYYCARMHDAGKILMDDVLLNYPRSLTRAEYSSIKNHAVLAYDIFSELHYEPEFCQIILCHHEHWDGSGYPYGLKGEAIPFFSRIICFADTWESMIKPRIYRPAMNRKAALREIERCRNWFDPKLYEICMDVVKDE